MKTGGKTKKKLLETKPAAEEKGSIKKTKIRVIGIGGGGGNIVSEIACKISKASFVVADTDIKSLKNCNKKVTKFQFGQDLTGGLGTGMNPQSGKEAALAEKERIKKFCHGQDLSIFVASLGGGTGSGSISTFAKISKDLRNLTYGIFTLPFNFEGERKMEIAMNSLKEAKNHFNAITVIPNERVFQIINKETPLKEALSAINKFLSENLQGLIETIYEPGLINIDFADFKTILEGMGKVAYLNVEKIEFKKKTEERLEKNEAVKSIISKVLNSPLYPYTVKGARGVLLNIAGEKNLSLSEVSQISEAISGLVNPEAKIIFGISQNKKYCNSIKTVLLATDCDKGIKMSSVNQASTKDRQGDLKKIGKKRKKQKPAPESRTKDDPDGKNSKNPKLINKEKEIASKEVPGGSAKQAKKSQTNKEDKSSSSPTKLLQSKSEGKEEFKEDKSSFSPLANARVGKEKNKKNKKEKIRKNALQVKKEVEDLEREMLEKEKLWEVPAFLRKKTN
jgi:cell division protein FtsZ